MPNALLRTTAAASTPARIFHFTAFGGQRANKAHHGDWQQRQRQGMRSLAPVHQNLQAAEIQRAPRVRPNGGYQQSRNRQTRVGQCGDKTRGQPAADLERHPKHSHDAERVNPRRHHVKRSRGRSSRQQTEGRDHPMQQRQITIFKRHPRVPQRPPLPIARVLGITRAIAMNVPSMDPL